MHVSNLQSSEQATPALAPGLSPGERENRSPLFANAAFKGTATRCGRGRPRSSTLNVLRLTRRIHPDPRYHPRTLSLLNPLFAGPVSAWPSGPNDQIITELFSP